VVCARENHIVMSDALQEEQPLDEVEVLLTQLEQTLGVQSSTTRSTRKRKRPSRKVVRAALESFIKLVETQGMKPTVLRDTITLLVSNAAILGEEHVCRMRAQFVHDLKPSAC
jgi:hypothetical protein